MPFSAILLVFKFLMFFFYKSVNLQTCKSIILYRLSISLWTVLKISDLLHLSIIRNKCFAQPGPQLKLPS